MEFRGRREPCTFRSALVWGGGCPWDTGHRLFKTDINSHHSFPKHKVTSGQRQSNMPTGSAFAMEPKLPKLTRFSDRFIRQTRSPAAAGQGWRGFVCVWPTSPRVPRRPRTACRQRACTDTSFLKYELKIVENILGEGNFMEKEI